MNIVHIIPSLHFGGAETQLERIVLHSKHLYEKQTIITLINAETSIIKNLRKKGITIHSLNFNNWRMPFSFLFFIYLLRKLNDENTIFQCWMYHANLISFIAAWMLGMTDKIIWNLRRTKIPSKLTGYISYLCSKISNKYNIPIVCCAKSAIISHHNAGYNDRYMHLIHNGFDFNIIKPNVKARQLRYKNYAISDKQLVIGMVARYNKIKGHLLLLNVFKKIIVAKEVTSQLKLILVGRDVSTAPELQKIITDPSIKNHLLFLPEQDNIQNIMSCFDILCMPSESEGFPNVVVEAMACELPVIVTNVGDAAVIVDNWNMIAPAQNTDVLFEKLVDLINLNKKEALSIGVQNRQLVTMKYSIQVACHKYQLLYRNHIHPTIKS